MSNHQQQQQPSWMTQDWTPVVVGQKSNSSNKNDLPKEVVRRVDHSNREQMRRLDNLDETESSVHHRDLTRVARMRIQQARLSKNLTQAELAKLINERTDLVVAYEKLSGVVVPDIRALEKLERVLQVKLRGKGLTS